MLDEVFRVHAADTSIRERHRTESVQVESTGNLPDVAIQPSIELAFAAADVDSYAARIRPDVVSNRPRGASAITVIPGPVFCASDRVERFREHRPVCL